MGMFAGASHTTQFRNGMLPTSINNMCIFLLYSALLSHPGTTFSGLAMLCFFSALDLHSISLITGLVSSHLNYHFYITSPYVKLNSYYHSGSQTWLHTGIIYNTYKGPMP